MDSLSTLDLPLHDAPRGSYPAGQDSLMLSALSSAESECIRPIIPLVENRWFLNGLLLGPVRIGPAGKDVVLAVKSLVEHGLASVLIPDVVLADSLSVPIDDLCSMIVVSGVPWP